MNRTNVFFAFCVCVLLIPCSSFASKRLNELELAHREASKEWARTLGESAEASLRVKRYKAAFEARLRGVMRSQDYPAWLRLLGNKSLNKSSLNSQFPHPISITLYRFVD